MQMSQPSEAEIRRILDRLVLERQQLRRAESEDELLEANRLGLVYWQNRLHQALLAEHAPAA
jgi:hypothetical protein